MPVPIGPSLRLVLALNGFVADVSFAALEEAWARWMGPERFARRLARLERAGLVKSGKGGGDVERVVRLTEAGQLAAQGGRDPETAWARPWDGRWRMVLFDVREEKRSARIALQRKLRRLSFGYLQDSVWISTDSIEPLASALGRLAVDAGSITLFDGRPCGGETDADLVRGAWDFTRINRMYQDYLEVLRSTIGVDEASRRTWLQTEWRAWCRALNSDPLLPESLLPRGYKGRDAWERRRDRMQTLVNRG